MHENRGQGGVELDFKFRISINFGSRRISLVEFYPNDQTSKSILEKYRGDMKKRKVVQGGPFDDLSRTKRIIMIALTVRLVEGSFCLHPLTHI